MKCEIQIDEVGKAIKLAREQKRGEQKVTFYFTKVECPLLFSVRIAPATEELDEAGKVITHWVLVDGSERLANGDLRIIVRDPATGKQWLTKEMDLARQYDGIKEIVWFP